MIIREFEFKRGGKLHRGVVEFADGTPWSVIRMAAIQMCKMTHSVNVRVGSNVGWSDWLY